MEQEQKEKKHFLDFWKQFFRNNLVIKLLSCIFAVFVWLLITNVADPYKSKIFSVDVEIVNEDAISSAKKVFEVVEGRTATVKVMGRRSIVDKLSSDDVAAVADLSELSSVNAVVIKAKIKKSISGEVKVECDTVMKIALEDMEKKQIKVNVNCEGTLTGSYTVGDCVAKPNVIEVSGGASVIDRISSVSATVNVNGAYDSFTSSVEPKAYDEKGNQIVSPTLKFSVKKVRVRVKILQKKTVPVTIEIKGKPAKGYTYVEFSSSPEEIEIAGNNKKYENLNEVVIPIDITGFKSTSAGLEQNISVEEYLDESIVVPAEEDRQISVKITVEPLAEKYIQILPGQISFKGLGEGYAAEILTATPITVLAEGRVSVLESLNGGDLSPYVDCKGLAAGTHTLQIALPSDDEISVVKPARIKIKIEKKMQNDDNQPSPDVQTPLPEESPAAPAEEQEEE